MAIYSIRHRGQCGMRHSAQKDLTPQKTEAIAEIDAAAEVARLKYITAGSGQAMEYQQVAAEAQAYLAGGDTDPDLYPMMVADQQGRAAAGVERTLGQIALEVNERHQLWMQIGAQIRQLRVKHKLLVEQATSPEGITAALDVPWP